MKCSNISQDRAKVGEQVKISTGCFSWEVTTSVWDVLDSPVSLTLHTVVDEHCSGEDREIKLIDIFNFFVDMEG